jgi:hypothetical protein
MDNCAGCPCTPEGIQCRRRPDYCAWVAAEDVERYAHITNTSRLVADHPIGDYPPITNQVNYPSMATQTANLWRSLKAFVRSGGKFAPRQVRAGRLAICQACPKYDPQQKRCTSCGCVNSAKVYIAADACPLDPPRWKAVDHG